MKSATKVWVFLALASFFTIYLGAKLYGRTGLLFAFCIASLFVILAVLTRSTLLFEKLGARELCGQDSWGINLKLDKWAQTLSQRPARLFILDSPAAVACSVVDHWGDRFICLSEGLLKKLSPDEVEAILVHQLCHLIQLDNFFFAAASLMANTLLRLAEGLDQLLPLGKVSRFPWRQPFSLLISPLAWLPIRLNIRETSHFADDDLASQVLPNRKVLAQALWKLESLNQARPLDIPACSNHLFVVNPRGLRDHNWFYRTHPKMSLRLKRMIGYEPL